MPDKAMVFAAGLGTRMRPLTETIPKPLVKVGGRPMIDHLLDLFAQAGVGTAIVNVHHLADQIETHLNDRTAPHVIISDERDRLLDQGGAIKKALPLLGKAPFFLCNTDAFWVEGAKPNLERLADAWSPDEMDVLLLVAATSIEFGRRLARRFHHGRFWAADETRGAPCRAFRLYWCGHHQAGDFRRCAGGSISLAAIFPQGCGKGTLYGLRLDGIWLHVGTPAAIADAERLIERSVL